MNWYKRFTVLGIIIIAAVFIAVTDILATPKEYTAEVLFLPDNKLMPVLLKDFDESSAEIKCALYMFRTDSNSSAPPVQLRNAMLKALERGVKVGVVLELGEKSDITTHYNTYTGKALKNAGATVVFSKPERRMHTKMCVVDGKTVFIGSHNYTSSAMLKNSEVTVRVRSPEIASESLKYLNDLGLK
ncbi:MAG: phospholipase D-like domain-containing protein [Deferribacteraceae bacterium]|nr:phospholipase D-like domain-containing protein [Deferribacteraceae bacterium]